MSGCSFSYRSLNRIQDSRLDILRFNFAFWLDSISGYCNCTGEKPESALLYSDEEVLDAGLASAEDDLQAQFHAGRPIREDQKASPVDDTKLCASQEGISWCWVSWVFRFVLFCGVASSIEKSSSQSSLYACFL